MSICYVWLATTSRPPSTATLLQIYKEKMKRQRKREKNLRLDLSFTTTLFPRKLSFVINDNNDNGKNGRNTLCHEVTYNWDNKITVTTLICKTFAADA